MKVVVIAKTQDGYSLAAYDGRILVAGYALASHDDLVLAQALREVQAAHCGPMTPGAT